LWHDYPPDVQRQLKAAQATGEDAVDVCPITNQPDTVRVQLATLQQVWSGSGKTQAVRVAMDTPIFWSEPNLKTDSNVEKQIVGMGRSLSSMDQRAAHTQCCGGSFPVTWYPYVVLDPCRLIAASSNDSLRSLVVEGLLDPLQFFLHTTDPAAMSSTMAEPRLMREWRQAVNGILSVGGLPEWLVWNAPIDTGLFYDTGKGATMQRRGTLEESRTNRSEVLHTDGLAEPEVMKGSRTQCDFLLEGFRFYPPSYQPAETAMQHISGLSHSPLRYRFSNSAVLQLFANFATKLGEFAIKRRSASSFEDLTTEHFFCIYAYTYEMPSSHDQIYSVLNRCMRTQWLRGLEFWRPFIFHLNAAMALLPPVRAKLFRGINVTFEGNLYQKGSTIRWPAYSSASSKRSVAEDFAEGNSKGTLFFIASERAVGISAFSRFGGEGEVLFPPNTLFEVTSTLFTESAIGAFYSECDNIEMREITKRWPRKEPQGRRSSGKPPDKHGVCGTAGLLFTDPDLMPFFEWK